MAHLKAALRLIRLYSTIDLVPGRIKNVKILKYKNNSTKRLTNYTDSAILRSVEKGDYHMLTSLGKFLRKIRIDNDEYLKDMADRLQVTVSFLSAVENGKKKMPSTWNRKICSLYKLNEKQIQEFTRAIAESEEKIELNIKDLDIKNQCLAVSFARKLSDLSDHKLDELMKIMEDE
jgi:transcriptional regulator with XRE-family HTH domain